MRRLILPLLVALVTAPLAVDAQQAGKVYRIGWLGITSPSTPLLQLLVRADQVIE